ncbi:MAG: DUF2726 domain-containing protein [Planctomycetia bacterium]|nr:DUF2726 domain-containing protein [Planctomycetia bacterium]
MTFFLAFFVLVFFLVVLFSINSSRKIEERNSYNYSVVPLMTPAEIDFYNILVKIISDDFLLFSKTGLWAVIRNNEHDRKSWNKISQKHLDFIIVFMMLRT